MKHQAKDTLRQRVQCKKGFTLIEMSMVVVIFGLISTILLGALQYYNSQQVRQATEDAMDMTEAALIEFKITQGRYPCPADPSLGPANANYGFEAQPCDGTIPYITDIPGGRDTPADTDTNPDRVLVGAVPINTLLLGPDKAPNTFDEITFIGLTDKLTLDGWGNKLTYAVTRSQTSAGTYNDFNGAISVVDENNLSVMGTPSTAHFVLISHGPNGRGAFTDTGAQVDPCPPNLPTPVAPAVATPANELWNCNNGGPFLMGLKNDVDHSYNDDIVRIVVNESSGLWAYTGLNRVDNTNAGNVGIGTPDPVEKLHVAGRISANNFWADSFCDSVGNNCIAGRLLDPAFDADTATAGTQNMRCPAGQVVTEIRNNQVVCAVPPFVAGAMTCAPGTYLIGISSKSGALCCDPLLPSTNKASCSKFVP